MVIPFLECILQDINSHDQMVKKTKKTKTEQRNQIIQDDSEYAKTYLMHNINRHTELMIDLGFMTIFPCS